jgi:hypothetical protein
MRTYRTLLKEKKAEERAKTRKRKPGSVVVHLRLPCHRFTNFRKKCEAIDSSPAEAFCWFMKHFDKLQDNMLIGELIQIRQWLNWRDIPERTKAENVRPD